MLVKKNLLKGVHVNKFSDCVLESSIGLFSKVYLLSDVGLGALQCLQNVYSNQMSSNAIE